MKTENNLFKPSNLLGIWALYHLVVWTLLPLLCNTCLPLDSIEAVMWGSQWQWGYDKHPPLSAWMPELFTNVLGDGGLYLLSQLCIVIAGVGIYKLGRLLKIDPLKCVFAVLLLDTVYYYQFISVEFNVNIMQMPFWAWGWFFGIDAVQNKRLPSWFGLGICIALGALTKYIAVFMLVPLFAAWWARGELKKVLRSPGIYIAGVVSLVIFMPHLIWMKNHEWMTITYGLRRGGTDESHWWHHIIHPLEFLLTQAAILAPLIIVSLIAIFRGKKNPGAEHPSHQQPTTAPPGTMALALGSFVFMAIFSLFTGMAPVTMWAAPMPLAIGLWLVPRFNLDRMPKTVFSAIGVMSAVFVIGYGITYGAGPLLRDKPHRVNYPGKELAQAVEGLWHGQFSRPLDYIIADEFLGGIVNHYGADGGAVMIRASLERSAYLSEEDIRQNGAVILWLKSRNSESEKKKNLNDIYPDLSERFETLQLQTDLIIPWPRQKNKKSGRFGIAYIPPAS